MARAMAAALRRPWEVVSVPMAAVDECYLAGVDRIWSGAEPGAIIRTVRRLGTPRLLLVLDEIDKVGTGNWRGSSPTAWLLEYPRDRADSSKVKTWGTAAVGEVKQFQVCGPRGRDSHGSPAVRKDGAFRKSFGLIREVSG